MNSFKQSLSVLMRVLHVTISFNDTGFVQCPQQFYQVARLHPNSLNNKSTMAFWHKNTVYQDKNNKKKWQHNRFVSKDSSPGTSCPSSFDLLNAIDKHLKRKYIRSSIFPTWTTNKQCLEPFASFAGSINIWLSTLLSTHALKYAFALSSEL